MSRAKQTEIKGANSPQLVEQGSRAMLEALLTATRFDSKQKALNVLCGNGDAACKLANAAKAQVIGIDPSPAYIETARQKAKIQGIENRVTFEVGDPGNLSNHEGEFDLVFCDQLGALPNLVDISRQWGKAAKSGGYVALFDLCWMDEPSTDEKNALTSFLGSPTYTLNNYMGLFKTSGLQDVTYKNLTEPTLSLALKKQGGFSLSLDALKMSRQRAFFQKMLKTNRLAYALIVGKKA